MITLIQTQPGVSIGRGPTAINGLRTSAANVTVDGINVQDNYLRRNALDFMPDRFLTRDGRHLLCSTHGALFDIATGLCLHGPCKGRSLRAVPVALRDGMVVVTDQPEEFG